jgi:hypothetical protein
VRERFVREIESTRAADFVDRHRTEVIRAPKVSLSNDSDLYRSGLLAARSVAFDRGHYRPISGLRLALGQESDLR